MKDTINHQMLSNHLFEEFKNTVAIQIDSLFDHFPQMKEWTDDQNVKAYNLTYVNKDKPGFEALLRELIKLKKINPEREIQS